MMATRQKPLASLSLDLDNKWSYLKTHGEPQWSSFPTYLPTVVPRVLEFLSKRNLTITFFVVGQDTVRDENREPLRALADAGHEIGNHSFHHEPWLHLYSETEMEDELTQAEDAIESVTGQRPVGFRGPGFSLSATTLKILARKGYQYDASTFPTFLGPLARTYYFMTAKLSAEEMRRRRLLFGTFSEGFRPLRPYQWKVEDSCLLEIPVTTLPLFKVPMHVSYLLYLSAYSPALASLYWGMALRLCRMTGTQPSLLLHPLDFLGCDDTQDLSFFPAMALPSEKKVEWVGKIIEAFMARFTVVTMKQHAQAILSQAGLPRVEPRFPDMPKDFFALAAMEG